MSGFGDFGMSPSGGSATRMFMCLRESFCSTFPWNHQRLKRDAFIEWARTRRKPPIRTSVHDWRPMRDGKPVRREIIEAFSEYIGERQILPEKDCRLAAIADRCDPQVEAKPSPRQRQYPAWALGWTGLYAHMASSFAIDDEAYCANEADLRQAAYLAAECIARHDGLNVSGAAAIEASERIMGRTFETWVEQMLYFWQANEASVMFGTMRRGGKAERIAVNIMFPITEDFQRRLFAGEADDATITPADLAPRSQYLWVHTVVENRAIDVRRDKAARSFAHWRTALYQAGCLLLPVRDATQPHLIAVLGTKEGGRRAQSFGFAPVGVRTPVSKKELVEFAPPSRDKFGIRYPLALAEYLAMKSMIQIYQAYIETQGPAAE